LQNVGTGSSTFSTILRKTTSNGSAVPVVEPPSTHNIQPSFLSRCKTFLDIGSKLNHVSLEDVLNSGMSYVVEGKVVSIASCKVEIFPIKLEDLTFSCNKTLRCLLSNGYSRSTRAN
jgi:hypothetical protein